jgi:hypothetical protein
MGRQSRGGKVVRIVRGSAAVSQPYQVKDMYDSSQAVPQVASRGGTNAGGIKRIGPRQIPDLRKGLPSPTRGIFLQLQPLSGDDEPWGGKSSVSERSVSMRVIRMT